MEEYPKRNKVKLKGKKFTYNQMHYFYLARCADKTLYAGYTTNIKDREIKHNKGEGAKYTMQRRPIKIVYYEEYATKSEALKREIQVKKMKREKKDDLIRANKK